MKEVVSDLALRPQDGDGASNNSLCVCCKVGPSQGAHRRCACKRVVQPIHAGGRTSCYAEHGPRTRKVLMAPQSSLNNQKRSLTDGQLTVALRSANVLPATQSAAQAPMTAQMYCIELTDNSPQRRPTRPTMPIRYVEARRGAMGARDIWILQLCRHTHRFRPVPSHTTVGNTGSARVATCRACTVCRLEARRLTGMQRSTAGTGEKSTVC